MPAELLPTGVGTYTEWGETSPAAQPHWQMVDDPTTDDTTYVFDNTFSGTERDTYIHGGLPGSYSGGLITHVAVEVTARMSNANQNNVRAFIRSNGVDAESPIFTLTQSFLPYRGIWKRDPATGLPWTRQGIAALQFGMRNAMGGVGGAVQVTRVVLLVYFGEEGQQEGLTVVRLRSPFPPHETVLELLPTNVVYGNGLMRENAASFSLSRTDPNINSFGHMLHPDGPAPMYTIERPDGLHPYVGFLFAYDADAEDPEVHFTLRDHAWRFRAARTKRGGTASGSLGGLLPSIIHEIDQRTAPPLFVNVQRIKGGPSFVYDFRAQSGLDFLTQVAQFTGWEWHFNYGVTPGRVTTSLEFEPMVGSDRRDEVVLQEGLNLKKAHYSLNYENGIAEAYVVGGDGDFNERSAVSARATGGATDATPRTVGKTRRRGMGGTRILIDRQMSGPDALKQAAFRLHESPEYGTERFGLVIVEDALDMKKVNVGDVVTVRLNQTDLAMPLEREARIVQIGFDPQKKEHAITTAEIL